MSYLMEVGQVSVEATVRETNPMANTALKAASTPITPSGDLTASRVRANRLHMKKETPVIINKNKNLIRLLFFLQVAEPNFDAFSYGCRNLFL